MKERKSLVSKLQNLDKKSVCTRVEEAVSKHQYLSCFPEQQAFWATIRGSDCLRALVSEATDQFSRLYLANGRGKSKYAHFFRAWMQYMLAYTGDQPNEKESNLWSDLAKLHPDAISENTRRVIVCDILHTLQDVLQRELIIELDTTRAQSSLEPARGSDDTALYRIGGWALFSATKLRKKHLRENKENTNTLNEELSILKALSISHTEKETLPVGIKFLDRGGLTLPKKSLLPYLRVLESRMLDMLNDQNYKRYGNKLFEVQHTTSIYLIRNEIFATTCRLPVKRLSMTCCCFKPLLML